MRQCPGTIMFMVLSFLRVPDKERPPTVRAVLSGEAVNFVPKLVVLRTLAITARQGVAKVLQVRYTGLGLPVLDQLVQFRRDGNAFCHESFPSVVAWPTSQLRGPAHALAPLLGPFGRAWVGGWFILKTKNDAAIAVAVNNRAKHKSPDLGGNRENLRRLIRRYGSLADQEQHPVGPDEVQLSQDRRIFLHDLA